MTTEDVGLGDFTTVVTYVENDEEEIVIDYICGDGYCDPFGESAASCPEDCVQEGSSNMLVPIIIGVIVLIAIIVVVVLNLPKKKSKPVLTRPVRKPAAKVVKKPVKKPSSSGPKPLFKK